MLLLPTSFALLPPAHSVAAARRCPVPVAAESPPPFTISRKVLLYHLAVVTGYASLLLAVSKAEEDPAYQAAVARTIASAVPSPNLRVLEIGIGRAANLDAYPRGTELVGLDASLPAEAQRARIVARAGGLGLALRFVEGDATALPFDAGAFDAVVVTKVLCSVSDPAAALREVSRVLAPGGRFGFVEHVAADRGSALETQQLLLDPAAGAGGRLPPPPRDGCARVGRDEHACCRRCRRCRRGRGALCARARAARAVPGVADVAHRSAGGGCCRALTRSWRLGGGC